MKRLKKYTALVVDDDLESLNEMVDYLDFLFAKVYKSFSAKEAIELIESKKPNIIFTDIEMPEVDGFSFISQIKDRGNSTPVVVISAYDNKEKLFKAIKLDIVDYLVKPLSSKKLNKSINLWIKKLEDSNGVVYLDKMLFWNQKTNILLSQNKPINLTQSEIKLLNILVKHVNMPVDGEDIFYDIWGDTSKIYNPKNIRNVVYSLRKKLDSFDLIQNVYGNKYRIKIKDMF